MQLINLDDWVLIGPGSEWFWTAVSGIVVAVTLVGLHFQRRMQRAAAAIEQMNTINREFRSEAMLRSKLAVVLALQDGCDPGDMPSETADITDHWERLGLPVRCGHVDHRLVNGYLSLQIRSWWAEFEPFLCVNRVHVGDQSIGL